MSKLAHYRGSVANIEKIFSDTKPDDVSIRDWLRSDLSEEFNSVVASLLNEVAEDIETISEEDWDETKAICRNMLSTPQSRLGSFPNEDSWPSAAQGILAVRTLLMDHLPVNPRTTAGTRFAMASRPFVVDVELA